MNFRNLTCTALFLLASCSGNADKLPVFGSVKTRPVTVHFHPGKYPDLSPEKIRQVWITGSFNHWIPGLWPLKKMSSGIYAARLRLRDGKYYFRYQVELTDGRFLSLHDPAWTRVYDDGAAGAGNTARSCLIYKRSGWLISSGKKHPLPEGSSPTFSKERGPGK